MISEEQLQALQPHLFAGNYNLLLGSGTSLDAFDQRGEHLSSAGDLAATLCDLKQVPAGTSLARVSQLLDQAEKEKYITRPYRGCKPGETAKRLTAFVWKTAFTFNVDDVLEAAYERSQHAKQSITSLNFDSLYQQPSNKAALNLIHLHGFTRDEEKGYVFSTTEYARVTRGLNSWMHILSELLASEPFIISGTSLNEPDLDYYLSSRQETALANNRGPSFFVEPYPNKLTENLCKRHGLILIKAKLSEFLQHLSEKFGDAPNVTQLTVPSLNKLFDVEPTVEQQLTFFASFELVKPAPPNAEGEKSPFYYGQAIRWTDLESSLDVPTEAEQTLSAEIRNALSSQGSTVKLFCTIGDSGSGKTTQIRRVAYDLSKEGRVVLALNPSHAIGVENTISVLSRINRPIALVIDGIANQAASVQQIIAAIQPKTPIVIIGADRDYRRDHIERLLGHLEIQWFGTSRWKSSTYEQLLERLRKRGLLGNNSAVHSPLAFASRLIDDPVAVGTCRALNNFRPLETILRSIWRDASANAKRSFATAALAEYCYDGGVRYSILAAAFDNDFLGDQLDLECPLPLAYIADEDFVVPLNAVIGDRLLHMLSREKPEWLLEIFCNLANALSPYVNRRTSIDRTPEAQLAARLFNAEQITRNFLGRHAEQFYVTTREAWQWNSRYWEQRALYTQWQDLDTAIQYGRHAVAIEGHPFPWTTLASLLTKKLEISESLAPLLYNEVFQLLSDVFKHETGRSWRPMPPPYVVLLNATEGLLSFGRKISPKQSDTIKDKIAFCQKAFPRDANLLKMAERVLLKLR